MKTISNPQSIFGGRTFKGTTFVLGSYRLNMSDEGRLTSFGSGKTALGGGATEGNGGDCFSFVFGEI